jgi:antitoxin component of MazEF toxin-antitoxin module
MTDTSDMRKKTVAAPTVRFARLSKNGTSLSITIPPTLLAQLGWRRGDAVELWLSDTAAASEHLVLNVVKARSARELGA